MIDVASWRRSLGWVVALVSLVGSTSSARAADFAATVGLTRANQVVPQRQDCDAASFQTVLRATKPAPEIAARAVWLTASLVRWPRVDATGRFRLYHSAAAQIVVEPGAKMHGADGVVPMAVHEGALPAGATERFNYVGAGVVLALPASAAPRVAALHREQLVLVQEDERGRVRRASRVQVAGAMDDLYRAAARGGDLGVRIVGAGAAARSEEGSSALPAAQPKSAARRPTGAPGARSVRTRFSLWAPTAQRVAVCLYAGSAGRARTVLMLHRDAATGVWSAAPTGNLSGGYYAYLVDVVVPGVGLVRNRVSDPYSVSLNTDSRRSYVADLGAANLEPTGWRTTAAPTRVAAPTDMVIYELHVRDFSINDATVPTPWRGKYAAFTATDSNGMRHLRRLADAGLTDVHLLPEFDFASVPESGCLTPAPHGAPDGTAQQAALQSAAGTDCFNWGYDPLHFGAPEGSYATDAADGATRIVEFRRMVQALHRLGLRVGMDVVYNHTSASGQHEKSVLDRIVPGYYHRLDAEGRVEHSTCCENTATENLMMARLMIDTAVRWARDYGVDSFRFDLMGHQPRAVMQALQASVDAATGRHVELIGEGWNFGEVADGRRFVQASQLALGGSGIATFSDRGRDAVRGGSAGDDGADQVVHQGYINGLIYDRNALAMRSPAASTALDLLRSADLVRVGLAGTLRGYEMQTHGGATLPLERIDYAGQSAGYASQPGEVVNYVENHDNQTLFDTNVFKLPAGTDRADRARVQTLGAAIVAFSQGIAYFHAGQELLRSKSMDRNSFDSGDWFNRIDWSLHDNNFGVGLPPQRDNARSWPLMQPLLSDPGIAPTPADIAWTRDAFLDLLKIRASSTLFRLRSADDVRARLTFLNTGPDQVPTVLVGHLDGAGYAGAGFKELVYLINVDKVAQVVTLDALKGRAFTLHPVHRAVAAADKRAANDARYDGATGSFSVPPRTALVYVVN